MFQLLEVCYTTGGICPHKEEVVPRCVTEGFCGGRHGPLTGIEGLQWKPVQFLAGGDVTGALTRAAASAPGANVRWPLPRVWPFRPANRPAIVPVSQTRNSSRQHPLLSPLPGGSMRHREGLTDVNAHPRLVIVGGRSWCWLTRLACINVTPSVASSLIRSNLGLSVWVFFCGSNMTRWRRDSFVGEKLCEYPYTGEGTMFNFQQVVGPSLHSQCRSTCAHRGTSLEKTYPPSTLP